ncbi:hypothetical protein AUQ37_00035 [Candidatus Methanomethylophilus sp. 1R26]|nr:hypothetical protein AUQ37_00035 [Candidatus Methanomethylophilus sp. 1R26]
MRLHIPQQDRQPEVAGRPEGARVRRRKELSKLFDYTMGWSGTSGIVEQWMYTDLAERFVLDKETREWIKDVNPYAMAAMLARLYEAKKRGFWDPDDEMLSKLKDVYLEFEEKIEEITDS